jgi:hypothetical protein
LHPLRLNRTSTGWAIEAKQQIDEFFQPPHATATKTAPTQITIKRSVVQPSFAPTAVPVPEASVQETGKRRRAAVKYDLGSSSQDEDFIEPAIPVKSTQPRRAKAKVSDSDVSDSENDSVPIRKAVKQQKRPPVQSSESENESESDFDDEDLESIDEEANDAGLVNSIESLDIQVFIFCCFECEFSVIELRSLYPEGTRFTRISIFDSSDASDEPELLYLSTFHYLPSKQTKAIREQVRLDEEPHPVVEVVAGPPPLPSFLQ